VKELYMLKELYEIHVCIQCYKVGKHLEYFFSKSVNKARWIKFKINVGVNHLGLRRGGGVVVEIEMAHQLEEEGLKSQHKFKLDCKHFVKGVLVQHITGVISRWC